MTDGNGEAVCFVFREDDSGHKQQRGRKVGKAEAEQAGVSTNYGGRHVHQPESEGLLKFCTPSAWLHSPPDWAWLGMQVGRTSWES